MVFTASTGDVDHDGICRTRNTCGLPLAVHPEYEAPATVACKPEQSSCSHLMPSKCCHPFPSSRPTGSCVIFNAGVSPRNRQPEDMASSASIAASFKREELVILGTQYAGRRKRGVCTLRSTSARTTTCRSSSASLARARPPERRSEAWPNWRRPESFAYEGRLQHQMRLLCQDHQLTRREAPSFPQVR